MSARRLLDQRPGATGPPRDETEILYEIISTVASTLDLERVLSAIVRLLCEASGCHACFVYLDDGEGLLMRAASAPYRSLVGRLRFAPGEGMVGWVARTRQPVFLRDGALSDPRMRYVPELEEERFQSFVAVPLVGHAGDSIGAISLHTEAPREFTEQESQLLIGAASLVAGAVENARLYESARRRLGVLESLSHLGETVSRAETLEALLSAVVAHGIGLLDADGCQLYLLEAAEGRLRLCASAPPSTAAPSLVDLAAADGGRRGPHLAGTTLSAALFGAAESPSALLAPLVAAGELLGFLAASAADGRAFDDEERDLAASIASQTAVAIKKIQLIERLTERNVIKDFFEDLGGGAGDGLAARGRRLGVDLDRPHLVLWAARFGSREMDVSPELERLETALGRALAGVVGDRRDGGLRALVPLRGTVERDLVRRLRELRGEHAPSLVVGVSSLCSGIGSYATGFEEARQAVSAAPVIADSATVVAFDDLGPYKYLLRVSQEGRVRDRHADALRRLRDYDRARQSQLLQTLEEYLRQRGNVSATAQALYVHPNTLRQRLRRISELTQLDVRTDDWLMIEIALKLLRLETALSQ